MLSNEWAICMIWIDYSEKKINGVYFAKEVVVHFLYLYTLLILNNIMDIVAVIL